MFLLKNTTAIQQATMGTDYRSKTAEEVAGEVAEGEANDKEEAKDSSPVDSFHLGQKSGGWKFSLDLIAILNAMSGDEHTPQEQKRKAHLLQDMIGKQESNWFWMYITDTTSFQPIYYRDWSGREDYVDCYEVMIPSYLLTKEDLEKFLRRHSYTGDNEYQSLKGEELDFLFDSNLSNNDELDPYTYVKDHKESGLSQGHNLIYFMIEGMPNCYATRNTDFS